LNFLEQLKHNLGPGPDYEGDERLIQLPAPLPVKVIAYYLPQFHPIPENDQWWGKGFTEWTNVTKSIPQFEGHYQPHLPGALGFYDLRIVDVIREQCAMASRHGIGGFCFHYYWFSGRKVLDTPLNSFLNNPDIEFPFCVNWANENWTRTWDGSEREVLLNQTYSPRDDDALVDSIVPFMRDPRYITIEGRPLVMIYKPIALPNPAQTVRNWRTRLRSYGIAEPYFVMPQAFGVDDPRPLGFDAAVGFPPHKFDDEVQHLPIQPRPFDAFAGDVLSYKAMAEKASAYATTDFTVFHGVCPGWDNAPRRPYRGRTFAGSTPSIYGAWLANACTKVIEYNSVEERLVFINAWNEWAEGAHLEPDRHYGFAYLRETARVLNRVARGLGTGPSAAQGAGLPHDRLADMPRPAQNARRLTRRVRNRLATLAESAARIIRPK
jgi:lipopolysaccharide biosynthesis protein